MIDLDSIKDKTIQKFKEEKITGDNWAQDLSLFIAQVSAEVTKLFLQEYHSQLQHNKDD